MVIHTSADLSPGEHPYACFSAESRPLTSAYIARVRVDRSMNSIEAQGVKTVPGHLLMMRWAEEETANQCSNTKESTGAPVSASEQDSHTVRHRNSGVDTCPEIYRFVSCGHAILNPCLAAPKRANSPPPLMVKFISNHVSLTSQANPRHSLARIASFSA